MCLHSLETTQLLPLAQLALRLGVLLALVQQNEIENKYEPRIFLNGLIKKLLNSKNSQFYSTSVEEWPEETVAAAEVKNILELTTREKRDGLNQYTGN